MLKNLLLGISDIKNITERLEIIEERRKNALSASFVGIWEWNIEDNSLLWDEGMFNIYDISPHKFTGSYNDWKDRLHPEDFALTEANLMDCINNPKKRYFYRFRIKRDEYWRWVSGIGNTVRDEDTGKPIKVVGINILEPTEEEMSAPDPRDFSLYKDSIESAIFPTVLSSFNGEMIYANKAYLDMMGVDNLNEINKYQWIKLVDPQYRDQTLEGWNIFISKKIEKFWGYVKYNNLKTHDTFIKKVICSRLLATGHYSLVLVDPSFHEPKDFIKASYHIKELEEEVEFGMTIHNSTLDISKSLSHKSSHTLWKFQIRRAIIEVIDKKIGNINFYNQYGISNITFNKDYLEKFEIFKDELHSLYKLCKDKLNDVDILEEIEKLFGPRLLTSICIPCKTFHGACLLAALAVSQDKETIDINLS